MLQLITNKEESFVPDISETPVFWHATCSMYQLWYVPFGGGLDQAGSVIQDDSNYGASKEPMNPLEFWSWICGNLGSFDTP